MRPTLPQVALLARASLLVTHGGNNSVTEALSFGVPLLVMLLDRPVRWRGGHRAATRRRGPGPDRAPRPLIAGVVQGLLRNPPTLPRRIGGRMRAEPGPEMAFEMPGNGIQGFRRKAVEMALAGIYDLRIHLDEVVMPLVRRLRIFELEGLSAAAERARADLATFIGSLEGAAQRFEERRARNLERATAASI